MGKTRDTGFLTDCVFTDSSNNVGIGGAANASYKLAVTGASLFTGAATFSSSVTVGTGINIANDITWTNNTGYGLLAYDGVRFLSYTTAGGTYLGYGGAKTIIQGTGGNVGIGTISPSYKLDVTGTGKFDGNVYTNGGVFRIANSGGTSAYGYFLKTSDWLGGGSTNYTPALASEGGYGLNFYVDGSTTKGMFITSGGDVIVGGTSSPFFPVSGRGGITVNGSSNSIYGLTVAGSDAGYIYHGGTHMYINNSKSNGNVYVTAYTAGVYLATNATSWTGNSDERLKNITGNIENAIDSLLQLRTVKHTWKSDDTNKEHLALIAQDVEKVFPQVIDKNKLPVKINEEQTDKTEYLGVRYTELIPVLVKAIQELSAKVTALENK